MATTATTLTAPTPQPGAARLGRARRLAGRMAALGLAVAVGGTFSGVGSSWANHQFSDVPNENPFHADIAWLVDHDIATNANPTFRPDAPVSRQAFAAFLRRYNEETELVTTQVDPPATTAFNVTAPCPAGKRAIGGHGVTDSTVLFITDTELKPAAGVEPSGYRVRWSTANATVTDASILRVVAVCAPGL